jgi:hypothetical protein
MRIVIGSDHAGFPLEGRVMDVPSAPGYFVAKQ